MIQGSIVAIVTPMLPNGDIDFEAFDRLLEWHIESGTDAVVVVGTTGESPTLTMEEHCAVIARAVKTVAGRIPVIAGTGSNSTTEAIYYTHAAKEEGADACLLVTPYYNKPPQEGLYQHFKKIAEEVDIPQILYNVPSRTGCDLLPETVSRLADIKNIVGIKEATGDLDRGQQVISLCGDRIAIYSGDDATALDLILAGGKGNISVTANVAPAQMHEMCRLALAGEYEKASLLNARLAGLHNSLFLEANPIPVKWALSELGHIKAGIRLPLVPLNKAYHIPLREAIRHAGLD
ncbi:4-hydroxy-tetrahydrodipicolinate synthase [Pseudohongiella sp. SYSU M77423]|uniref:4-hydroxy-tetrahydrodipicolinate synthase n=1 Tax=unclassified Pseudohongiella TaxID=2629611 RepID=UPI000C4AFB2B|nr:MULTISPECIES: 4-hydroxy-tetrahydrodipicolinate synthase [unclassified Pseudohongiella]MAY56083.1 4-hydroxy-tetrahydrodipicolinate synthase [Gammaproteobacteria bacterium]MBJ54808.1 4-hydroxy-tetrahydrodipicolinate synthase [Gammaproteobacteria bacterium]MDH7944920.1 4-hydroxy-tetrahydrodipicolinate synthase [Pseudohongiella sp. SYSU M77423]MEC8858372.1 4-hydroxy-tetrahydrodipicolinate synthase [Pseudomonadota bacterium]|tara:strand:- start:3110 stop:3985 length:876 start_codon:yes stop_codon:yes gene_type:complete